MRGTARVCLRAPSLWLGLLCYAGCYAMLQDDEVHSLTLDAEQRPSWVVGVARSPRKRLAPSWVVGVARAPRERVVDPMLGELPAAGGVHVKLADGSSKVLHSAQEFGEGAMPAAKGGVEPMVNKLFTDIATMHKITGEVNPKTATVPSKLVDAALFDSATADERYHKRDVEIAEKEKLKKNQRHNQKVIDDQNEKKTKNAAAAIIRDTSEAKLRKDQRKDIKNGVKAATLQSHEVVEAYKASVINVQLAKERWTKASDKAARSEAKLKAAVRKRDRKKSAHNKAKDAARDQHRLTRAALHQELQSSDQLAKEKLHLVADGNTDSAEARKKYARHEMQSLKKQSQLDKAKFADTKKSEELARSDRELTRAERNMRDLRMQSQDAERKLAEAAGDVQIKEHESKEMKGAADKAVFRAKDLMNAAAEIKQEDAIRKIGTPAEGHEAIATAKRAATFAQNALAAVNKALVANNMQKLAAKATNAETEAAMKAVKDHVTSKLLAAETVRATTKGVLSASQAAADKAGAAAEAAVASAAAAQAEKEKLQTVSSAAMVNANHAALIAKVALQNINRAAQGKTPLEQPTTANGHVSPKKPPPNAETPREVVEAEEKAAHAAKVALYNTMEEVKEYKKRTKAAANLIAKASTAASKLRQARQEASDAERGVLHAKEAKTSLNEQLVRLKREKIDAQNGLKKVKGKFQRGLAAKLQLPKLESTLEESRNTVLKITKDLHRAKQKQSDVEAVTQALQATPSPSEAGLNQARQNQKQALKKVQDLEGELAGAKNKLDLAKERLSKQQAEAESAGKASVHAAEERVLNVNQQIQVNNIKLDRAREKVQEKKKQAADATSEVHEAKKVKKTVSEMEAPLGHKGLSAEALTTAKRADLSYEIDRTAAHVTMQAAADAAKNAKAAIHAEKVDPESKKLIEAAKLAVLEARESAKTAHAAMSKLRQAAQRDQEMDAAADRVKAQMMKNAEALTAASQANARVLHAKAMTEKASKQEQAEVKKAEEAMDKATKAMEASGVDSSSMEVAKKAVEEALAGAHSANARAQAAAKKRQDAEEQAATEMERAKLLVKKARTVALSAKKELKRAAEAKALSGTADHDENAAEQAVKQAEKDIDTAEEKALASASSIEHTSLWSGNGTIPANSSRPDADQALVGQIDDSLSPQLQSVKRHQAASFTARAEKLAVKTALMTDSAAVRSASLDAMSQEHLVQQAQGALHVKQSEVTQAEILLRAKKKMLLVAKDKVEDSKAAVKAATNEAANKKGSLKEWWATRSDSATSSTAKKELEKIYSNKVVAVDTANKEYIDGAKSDLEVAIAKQMVAAKVVEAQNAKVYEAKSLEKSARSSAHETIQKADVATRNFQIASANMISKATNVARQDSPTKKRQAAQQEAEQMAVHAISKLADASANLKRVKETATQIAGIRAKLRRASAAVHATQEGQDQARAELAGAMTPGAKAEAKLNLKSWTNSYKERDAKYNAFHTELERATWKEQVSTVQTKHLLASGSAGDAQRDVDALEMKHMLSAVAAADAVQRRERTELQVLKTSLTKAQIKLDQAKADVKRAATGPEKYQAEMQEYAWAQKVHLGKIKVAAQTKKVVIADRERAKFDVDKLSDIGTPIVHTSIDTIRARTALRMSKIAASKAQKVEDYAQQVEQRKRAQVKETVAETLGHWKQVEAAADAAGTN